MPEVRELLEGETARAGAALLALRPHHGSAEAIVRRIDAVQRPQGYRVAGSFEPGADEAAAVATFRVLETLFGGRMLYVDDLSTLPGHRGRGHADALFAWIDAELDRLACDQLHLDSGVGAHRTDAHRFYFRHGLEITSFHFARRAR
jgi:GNAT superfamily N-acetyltransferase